MNLNPKDCFVSVDVETAGPIPGVYSLLSIGACLVEDDSVSFECLLKPISQKADPKALKISGFSLEYLEREGLDPKVTMQRFAEWLGQVAGARSLVFVGLNAGFDWSFINYYFHRYLHSNPFGFAALDIKALYMGATGVDWRESKSSEMVKLLNPKLTGDHDALNDARAQAELFRLIIEYRDQKGMGTGIGR
ncbi:MAG: 3'-5' exonuclease [Gammaproteobacteria bacterium]